MQRSLQEMQRMAEQGHAQGSDLNPTLLAFLEQTNFVDAQSQVAPAAQPFAAASTSPQPMKKKAASKAKANLPKNSDLFCCQQAEMIH